MAAAVDNKRKRDVETKEESEKSGKKLRRQPNIDEYFTPQGDLFFQCEVKNCKFSCTDKESLYIHQGKSHSRSKIQCQVSPYSLFCEMCDFIDSSPFLKIAHVIKSHPRFFVDWCNTCEKAINKLNINQGIDKSHAKTYHQDNPNWVSHVREPFVELCDKLRHGFFTGGLLLEPINPNQPNHCPLCNEKLLKDAQQHIAWCVYKGQQGPRQGKLQGGGGQHEDENHPVKVVRRVTQHGLCQVFTYRDESRLRDNFLEYFAELRPSFEKEIKKMFEAHKFLRISLETSVLFRAEKPLYSSNGEEGGESIFMEKVRHIHSRITDLTVMTDLDSLLTDKRNYTDVRIESFCSEASGYYVADILQFILRIYVGNSLKMSCYFQLSEPLKRKLGRKYLSYIINPQNTGLFCLLHSLSIQLTVLDEHPGEDIKCWLEKMAVDEQLQWDDESLALRYGKWFSILKERCDRNKLQFPITVSKNHLKKVVKCLELGDEIAVNFISWDDDKEEFFNVRADIKPKITDRICAYDNDDEAIKYYENCNIDLIILKKNSSAHCGLITNFRKLTKNLSAHKEPGYTCRLCYSRMFKAINYSNHVRDCLRSNVSQSVMKLPDCNPDGSKPIISCSSIVGREIPLFSQFFDTECSFTPKEYDKGGGFTQELKASLVLVRTFANFGPNEDDDEEVKKLK